MDTDIGTNPLTTRSLAALNVLKSTCMSKCGLRVDQERGLGFREQPETREQT